MVSTLLLASLSFGNFPEVPVGPVSPDLAQEVQPAPPPDFSMDEEAWAEGEEAARDRAARERAVREAQERAASNRATPQDGDEFAPAEDWAQDKKFKKGARTVEFRAMATSTLPIDFGRLRSSGDMLVGLRGELDLGNASALFSWDRGAASLFNWRETLTPTSYWNVMIGPSVWATRHNRIRLLGGVSAISASGTAGAVVNSPTPSGGVVRASGVQFGPTIGATVHLGIPVIGIEGAVLYTPISFQQVDARAEVVLRLLIFEVRAGYRARWVDSSRLPVESVYGPTVSLGLVF